MLELAIALLAVVIAAALLFRYVVHVVTVHDYQRGVRFRNGKLAGLLSTGTHVAVRPFSEIQLLDGRPTSLTLPPQTVLTADAVEVRVTLVARYVVVDPVTAVTGDRSWEESLTATLGVGLRQAVAGRTVDELIVARGELGSTIAAAMASDLARIGIELLGVDVRDVMVPAELRRASVAVAAARRDAAASLERARGEAAALRSLAEAGRLVDEHPSLLQLWAVHQPEAGTVEPADRGTPVNGGASANGGTPASGEGSANGGKPGEPVMAPLPEAGPAPLPEGGAGSAADDAAAGTGRARSRTTGRSGTGA